MVNGGGRQRRAQDCSVLLRKGQAPGGRQQRCCGGAKPLRMEGGWCQRCGIVTHVLCVSLETLDVRSEPAQSSSSGRGRGLAGFGTIAIASAPFRPDWLLWPPSLQTRWVDDMYPGDPEADGFCAATPHLQQKSRWGQCVQDQERCTPNTRPFRPELRVGRQGSKEQPAARPDRTGEPCLGCTCESRRLPDSRREPRGKQAKVRAAALQQRLQERNNGI